MSEKEKKNRDVRSMEADQRAPRYVPVVSEVLDDDSVIELVQDGTDTSLAVFRNAAWHLTDQVKGTDGVSRIPYAAGDDLLAHSVVLLPSEPEEYGSTQELVETVRSFIHRYVDLPSTFELIATYYVLFTWLYDCFHEVPYLRLRGDYGSGKTRFLLTVGSLCYKPIFASGASTVSPIFHMLNTFRGTLIIDEADFRFSDEKAEMVKILNNGHQRGLSVLRSEPMASKRYTPRAYNVFGPKLVASRGQYDDRALESRFITEETGTARLRSDIPISLGDDYRIEARSIRNKLLLYRFRHRAHMGANEELIDPLIEPRLNQILVPLLSVIDNTDQLDAIREFARAYDQEQRDDRGTAPEAQVLEVIRDLFEEHDGPNLPLRDIRDAFHSRHRADYDSHITVRWIGALIRKKLMLKPRKSQGVYVLSLSEHPKLKRLYERYGLNGEDGTEGDLRWEKKLREGHLSGKYGSNSTTSQRII